MSYNVEYKDVGIRAYKDTWTLQESIFTKLKDNKLNRRRDGESDYVHDSGSLIFVEHPHVYTLGKSGSDANLLIGLIQLKTLDAEFIRTDRGGDITYHGPGQLVGYPIFDLEIIKISLREYIWRIEEAIIGTLSLYGISGSRLNGATGVWIDAGNNEKARKICAIGVKSSRYITMHGFAFNVNTDLKYFNYINPCGYSDKGVTSLECELGEKQDFDEVKQQVKECLGGTFDLNWIK